MTNRILKHKAAFADTIRRHQALFQPLPLVAPRTPLDAQLSAAVGVACPCAANAMANGRVISEAEHAAMDALNQCESDR